MQIICQFRKANVLAELQSFSVSGAVQSGNIVERSSISDVSVWPATIEPIVDVIISVDRRHRISLFGLLAWKLRHTL
jgi:hypothetical protein